MKVNIRPTNNFGWIAGVVLGDGALGGGGYAVRLETTKLEYAKKFAAAIEQEWQGAHTSYFSHKRSRAFPNGTKTNSRTHAVTISSKSLYAFFRPYKQGDYHWTIPDIIVTDREARRGFLQGIFDAEGSIVDPTNPNIRLSNKHSSNLVQLLPLLHSFGMMAKIYRGRNRVSALVITSRKHQLLFKREIGFRLSWKKERLERTIVAPRYSLHDYRAVIVAKQRGLTYKEIQRRLGVNYRTACDWVNGRQPWAVRNGWEV